MYTYVYTYTKLFGSEYASSISIPTFHNIMCALADSVQATVSTVDDGEDGVLSQEVSGELVRFVTCEEYT